MLHVRKVARTSPPFEKYPMEEEIKRIEAKMNEMKERLKNTVDINYGRYNNEYVELAYQREVLNKKLRDSRAKKIMDEAAEESADRLYGKLRGTINIR